MPHRIVAPLLAFLAALLASATVSATPPPRIERGNLVLEGVPPHPPRILETLDPWLAGRGATFRDFLPDGGLLISTRFGEVEQAHRVVMPMGMREQLTFGTEPVGALSANPQQDGGFVFARDRGGDENAQLYHYRAQDRSLRLLTDGRSRHGGAIWSRDGQRLAFAGNARDGIATDIYIAEMAAAAPASAAQ